MILAAGSGKRTEQDVPKQFFNVYEKPVIIYTLEVFENHPDIDFILAVCLGGWEEILKAFAREYGISKLKMVVSGGCDGQESTKNGIMSLKNICSPEDVVIIHDGIRPMITQEMLTDCIETCRKYGSGLSAVRCQETIMRSPDGVSGNEGIPRSEIMRVQTPQAYQYNKILNAYVKAEELGICNEVYANTLLLRLGETLYFSKGSNKNIKITTMEDLDIFSALCRQGEQSNGLI